MVSRIISVEPFDLVIFGGTGDLAYRKLLPGLYRRFAAGQAPGDARIIGASRSALSREAYRQAARDAITEHVRDCDEAVLTDFLSMLDYVAVDAMSEAGWDALAAALGAPVEGRVRAYYLAVGPRLFGPICRHLNASGLAIPDSRVVVEKPLGTDLASARALNAEIGAVFSESQIYRIDHYLGKETVQNLMALRFSNALFEPLWNARHIDHVQITVAENLGVGGRGGYYDKSGAMRDMVQNHIMQLLCLTAMEPPAHFDADAVRDEKLKVLRALKPITAANADATTVRGQYRARGETPGYLEDSENPDSHTESYVAIKAEIGTWRWAGTPFYLRTGKRLRGRVSEIAVQFKTPPHSIFEGVAQQPLQPNALILRLQPDEAVQLEITIKEPGPGGFRLKRVPLDMSYATALGEAARTMPDAYERLLMDVIRGNPTLFMRRDEVEAAWAWIDPILDAWSHATEAPEGYDPFSAGPDGAARLLHADGRSWRSIAE